MSVREISSMRFTEEATLPAGVAVGAVGFAAGFAAAVAAFAAGFAAAAFGFAAGSGGGLLNLLAISFTGADCTSS
jgi:hypothetical protein